MPTFNEIVQEAFGDFPLLFSNLFNTLFTSAVILIVGVIAGRIFGKFIHKLLHEIGLNRLFKVTTGLRFSIEELVGNLISYFIYFVTIVMALNNLGLDVFIFNMVAVTIMIIVILSIALALKDFMPNFVAGVYIRQKKMLIKGQKVKFGTVEGKVDMVELIETKFIDKSGDVIQVPNSAILKEKIVKSK